MATFRKLGCLLGLVARRWSRAAVQAQSDPYYDRDDDRYDDRD